MNPEDRQSLIGYRLDQAEHTLRQAGILAEAQEWGGVVNRAYYAMFYAAQALLLTRDLGASKHTGVLALIDRDFIKPGLLPADAGRHLRSAFNLRQKTDYAEFSIIEPNTAESLLVQAEDFLKTIRKSIGP